MRRPRWRRVLMRPAVLWPAGLVLGAALALSALFWFQPRFLLSGLARHHPDVLFYVETDSLAVALTIDDAPDPDLTPRILEVLGRHGVRATFFVLGEEAVGRDDLIAAIRAGGHELGNHLFRDEPSIGLTEDDFVRQLRDVERLIGPLEEPKWARPGSGWFTPAMVRLAAAEGYRLALGAVYPYDNKLRRPGWIRREVLGRVFPGAILILHEGGPDRAYVVELLDTLIPALEAEGYAFLTLTELVRLEGR